MDQNMRKVKKVERRKTVLFYMGLTISLVILVVTALFLVQFNKPRVQLVEKESYFDTFEVDNDETKIICVLTIKNNTNEEITFSVNAVFDEDYKNGLVSDKTIEGTWNDTGLAEITLAPKEKLSNETITFSSQNAGCDTKTDRNLPEIQLVEK